MGPLANHKHELFAQALAKGETADAAYVSAGYKPSRPHASRLATNGNVKARAVELQERAAVKAEKTAADIVAMLDEDRALARELDQPSAAVSAAMGIAKILGLITDKVKHEGSVNWVRTISERRARA